MTFVIYLIIAVALSVALQPKPPTPDPAEIGDFEAPTAEEGKPIPVAFGTVFINTPNVVWYGDLSTTPIISDSGK